MQWLNKIIDEAIKRQPEGEIIVESGISPSGTYHMGYLREIITCDAIVKGLKLRDRTARHIHFVDDLDGFRKVPSGLPAGYEQYLGIPLCDMPAPDGSNQSYADYALKSFLASVAKLGVKMDVMRSHEKYRQGFFVPAIEKSLDSIDKVKQVLEEVSGRKLDDQWSPIQVNEEGYLKKRPFVGIDTTKKTIDYLDKNGVPQTISYAKGDVKLDWRLDWPARWWLMGVNVEPFGRDHATKGGSYDTGSVLMKAVFGTEAPQAVPYNFINRAGETKKMSASKGNGIEISEVVSVLPPEVIRYFVLRAAPDKPLFFDPQGGVVRLIDEFAELLAKENKSDNDQQLTALCTDGLDHITVSNVPFSHLVASYQAALKDPTKTMDIIERTEHAKTVKEQASIIEHELKFIDQWLAKWAPEDVKFELLQKTDRSQFSVAQKQFLAQLADKIEKALDPPAGGADGEWFHAAIYGLKDTSSLEPKEMFSTLYQVLIGKESGPRAGWFLSILQRDWLINRLRLEA